MNVRKLRDLSGLYSHLGILIYDAYILFSSHYICMAMALIGRFLLTFLFFSVFFDYFVFDRTRFYHRSVHVHWVSILNLYMMDAVMMVHDRLMK